MRKTTFHLSDSPTFRTFCRVGMMQSAPKRKLGVRDASFAKKGSIDVLPGARSPKQHKKLQRFRAGVEGIISFTKRCFGFDRCTWRGYASFHAYAWASVLCTNLLLMARNSMA